MLNELSLKKFCATVVGSEIHYVPFKQFKTISRQSNSLLLNHPRETPKDYDFCNLMEFFISQMASWIYTKKSDFYERLMARAILEDNSTVLNIFNSAVREIENIDINDVGSLNLRLEDLYRLTAWGVRLRPGMGRGFMPRFKIEGDNIYVVRHAILRTLNVCIKHDLTLVSLDNSNTNGLDDFSIFITKENDIFSLQLSSEDLTHYNVNTVLIKHILYREKFKTIADNKLGIKIYNPLYETTYEVTKGYLNPMLLSGLANIILKEKNSQLMKNYRVEDCVDLIDLTNCATAKIFITKVNDNIVYAKANDVDYAGYSTHPGVWWYEDSVYVEQNTFNIWQQHGLTKEEQKIYFDALAHSYFIYNN